MPHMKLFSYIRSSHIDPLPSQPNYNKVNNRTIKILNVYYISKYFVCKICKKKHNRHKLNLQNVLDRRKKYIEI